jgi:flagellar assembly protein FliH
MNMGSHQIGAESKDIPARVRPMEFQPMPPTAMLSHSSHSLPAAFTSESEKRIRDLEAEVARLRGTDSGGTPAVSEREAYELGRAAGLSESTKVRQCVLEEMARQLKQAIQDFHASGESYLHRVEQEVVRLALSIAARVLRREAEADPLLLSGAVRVALGQLSETAEVRLRIPAREEALWQELVRLAPNLTHRPALVADTEMLSGECLLESSMGTINLGLESQLEEVERGFFEQAEMSSKDAVINAEFTGHRRRRRPMPTFEEESPENFNPEDQQVPPSVAKTFSSSFGDAGSDSEQRELR